MDEDNMLQLLLLVSMLYCLLCPQSFHSFNVQPKNLLLLLYFLSFENSLSFPRQRLGRKPRRFLGLHERLRKEGPRHRRRSSQNQICEQDLFLLWITVLTPEKLHSEKRRLGISLFILLSFCNTKKNESN